MSGFWRGCAAVLILLGPALQVKESPHYNEAQCGDCHGRDLPEAVAAKGGRQALYDSLCRECHGKAAVSCRFHDGCRPSTDERKRFEPLMPLEKGRFFCLTCHDARIQCVSSRSPAAKENALFLRGNPKGPVSRFCFACHRAELYRFVKVHEDQQGACLYCHDTAPPAKGEGKRTHDGRRVDVCGSCHHALGPHPGGVDHTALDTSRKITCQTCHDPHESSRKVRYLLRAAERDALCRDCHGEVPEGKDSK